jgi:hypothetical protein
MVCPCDCGRLFSLCSGLLFSSQGETFGFVRVLILRLKNERHGDVVRAIRSNNASGFKNSHFKTFCSDLGLEHQFSSPYLACQNGVVERKNCSLCERHGRCLMSIRPEEILDRGGEYLLPCWEPNFFEGLLEQDVL